MKRILITTAFTVLVIGLGIVGTAAGQTGVSASADRGSAEIGESLTITGSGWVPGNRVSASICGNMALRGSSDCDLRGSRTIAADGTGSFRVVLVAAEPPAPCPCVVFVTSEGTVSTVRYPIEIAGVASAPVVPVDVSPARAFEILDARLVGRSSLAGYFGAATTRQLALTVENSGSEAKSPELAITWGTSSDPTHVVDVPEFDVVEPGEQVDLTIDVEFDALTFGAVNVAGTIGGAGDQPNFVASTSHYPWGLIITGVIAIQLLLLAVRNRIRRRLHPEEIEKDIVIVTPALLPTVADHEMDADDLGADELVTTTAEADADLAVVGAVVAPDGTHTEDIDDTEDDHDDLAPFIPASAVAIDEPDEVIRSADTPTPAPADDPDEVLTASTRLATQLRHETDLAAADHRARAEALAAQLRSSADEEIAAMRTAAEEEGRRLNDLAVTTAEETATFIARADEQITDLLAAAEQRHDEANSVLDRARSEAQSILEAAETLAADMAAEVEEMRSSAETTRTLLDQDLAGIRAEAEAVLDALEAKLVALAPEVEAKIDELSDRTASRVDALLVEADADQATLRAEARERMVDIVRRTAEQLVVQVFSDVDHAMLDPDETGDEILDLSDPEVVDTDIDQADETPVKPEAAVDGPN